MIVYRYAEGPPRRVAGTSYTRSSAALPSRTPTIPTFKYTHYTFIRALNTSRIDGIERWIQGYICVFPSSSSCSSLRASLDTLPSVLYSSLPLFLFLSLSFSLLPPFLPLALSLSPFPPLPPVKPTGRLANEAPLHRFCVGRAMLDWCRCVCKRAGQRQCFESSVRPHYFTPGLGTAIPSTSSIQHGAPSPPFSSFSVPPPLVRA